MIALREQIELDLADTLESEFRVPVVLITPAGKLLTKSDLTGEQLVGQVLYDSTSQDPETGMPIVVHKPVVTLRRRSLSRVPLPGEKWGVKIPSLEDPSSLTTFILERAVEDGGSFGFLRLYLTRAAEGTPS